MAKTEDVIQKIHEPNRISIESCYGIWLTFYEFFLMGSYRQQLLEISNSREEAETTADREKIKRKIYTSTIVRGDGEKDKVNRCLER